TDPWYSSARRFASSIFESQKRFIALFSFGELGALPRSLYSQDQLAAVEGLGVTAGSVALHPSQSHQREECALAKPRFGVLGREGIHDITDLLVVHVRLEWHEQARPAHVAVVFRNLVFEDEMISKCVPGEFRDQPVVLMRIAVPVS